MNERLRATSGSPYEAAFGFARAVRIGNRIIVAGTGPVEPDGRTTARRCGRAGDNRCCGNHSSPLSNKLGGTKADVVRTRMLLTDPGDQDAVGESSCAFSSARCGLRRRWLAWRGYAVPTGRSRSRPKRCWAI